MGQRRALVVGIAEFAADSRTVFDAEEATDSPAWPPLPDAGDWAGRAAAILDELGYQVTLLAGATAPAAADLGAAVTRAIQEVGPDDVVIVHVITHGDQPPDLDTAYAIGADGRRDEACNVDAWVRTVVAGGDARPRTLFLLDFCRSGVATVPRWHRRPFQASNRAWVLAASAPDSDAFDCAFSRAVVQVLREVAAGDFCTHPSRPTVPYLAVSARIRDVVAGDDGDDVLLPIQEPTGTPIDTMMAARLDLPFFPNPDHRRAAFDDALAAMDDRLAEFAREVDHLVDPRHFRDRAAARWEAGRRPGLFQGRERELRALSELVDGAAAAVPWIITGSPGVGKSALLGVLVCAAHPTLRHATEEVWGHLPAPAATPHLAAVHARQQTVDAITTSLLTQLAPESASESASAEALLEAVANRPVAPVIVIDSLDEAIDSEELSTRLMVPLTRARREDGSAACRLIVGMRPWEEFEPLRRAVALAGGTILDLDQVPAPELAGNLRAYIQRVLRAGRGYGSVDGHRFVTTIADGVAATLTRTGDAQPRWGGFLIARLFAEYVAHTLPPVTDQAQAERLLAHVPASLPEVLEMTLRRPEAGPWMRPVLAALAHARGVGMPPKIIRAIAPLFATGALGSPSTRDVRRALEDGRFYLRQSADVSGTSVFRLFHESLVEYLRAPPCRTRRRGIGAGDMSGTDRGALAGILLGQVGRHPDGSRRWAEADPYLLRHAVQHAVEGGRLDELLADPEFLVYADPATLIPALPGASSPDAVIAATVYRSALEDLPSALPERRRQYLAISGSRVGAQALARRLSRPFGSPALALEPLFSTGSEIKSAVRAVFDEGDFRVYAVAVARTGGRQVVVTTGTDREGYDTIVRFRDLRTGEPTLPPITITGDREHPGRVSRYQGVIAVSEVEGAAVVVLRSEGGLVVRSVATGQIVREHPTGEGYCLATGVLAGCAVAAVDEEPGILVRDLDTGAPVGPAIQTPPERVCSVELGEIGDHPVLVYASHSGRYGDEDPGSTCQVIDLNSGAQIGPAHRCSPRSGTAIARLGLHEGRPVVVVGPRRVHTDTNGQRYHPNVEIRDVFTGEERFPAWTQFEGIKALAVTLMDGHAVLVAGDGSGAVTVRDLSGGGEPYELLRVGRAQGGVGDLEIARADGRVLVLAACDDGALRVADLSSSGSGLADPAPGHQIGVESIALAQVGGNPVVLSGGHLGDLYRRDARTGSRTARLWHGDLRITDIAVTTIAQRQVVVTGSPRAGVRLHDLASGQPLADYRSPGDDMEWVHSVDVLWVDGRPVIVGAGDGGLVWMWDLLGGECLLRWKVPDGDAHRAVWRGLLVDGTPVLAGVQAEYGPTTGHIALYDLASRSRRDVVIQAFEGYNSTQRLAVHEHRGVPLVAFADFEGTLAVWEARTGTLVSRVVNDADTERPQTALACGEVDGRAVCVVGTQAGHLGVHDLLTGERLADTVLPGGWIHCLDIGDGGLVAVGYGQEVAVLDMGGAVTGGGS